MKSEFDDIIGNDKVEEDLERIHDAVPTKKAVKNYVNDYVYYDGIKLGTPKEIKELADVSFKVLDELKRYKRRFGDTKKYRNCFIEFGNGETEIWEDGKLTHKSKTNDLGDVENLIGD